MVVYELELKVFLLRDILQENALNEIASFIDCTMAKDPDMTKRHNTNEYKNYVFASFFSTESSRLYLKEKVYQVRVRTVDTQLAEFFLKKLPSGETASMKGLVCNIRKIPKRQISCIYTLTPAIVKSKSGGYWRDDMNFQEYEKRIKENLIKKYNLLTGEKLDEKFELYTLLEMTNRVPISVPYKHIRLLADKFQMQIADNPTSQTLAYMALGTGLCEMNGRGYGFANYHYV